METYCKEESFDEALSLFLNSLEPEVLETVSEIQKPNKQETALWFVSDRVS